MSAHDRAVAHVPGLKQFLEKGLLDPAFSPPKRRIA